MLKIIILNILFIGLLQADQLSESGVLHYLKENFARKDKEINERLPDECAQFLRTFSRSADTPEVLFILGRIFDQDEEYIPALIRYMELKRVYPGHPRSGEVDEFIRMILQNKAVRTFESHAQKINDYLAGTAFESSISGRFYKYLSFLYELDHPDINPILNDLLIFYLHTFDQDVQNPDQLLFWIAGLHKKERDWLDAMMAYEKILFIKPESMLIPEVLFNLAQLQYAEMNRYSQSKDNYVRLITDFPEKEIAGDGQFYLAELYQRKFDDPNEAVTNYRLLIEAYPDNVHAVEALKRIAEIHYDAERYEIAIKTYDEIYQNYRSHPFAPEALKEIEEIYRRKFDDYQRAAETLQKYADTYPEREDAAEMFYDAAEIYQEELNNKEKAIELLNAIIEKYPDSRYAEKAKDDIAEMAEK